MRLNSISKIFFALWFFSFVSLGQPNKKTPLLQVNNEGYYETAGFNVMVFNDFYPEGHQGGVTIIQCGTRVAANGDIRLETTPGQWSAVPKVGEKHIEKENGIISVSLSYPDSSKNRSGFNPIDYPDVKLSYTIKTVAKDSSVQLIVDLDQPIPKNFIGKVGFNLELFPGQYFGEHFLMDGASGMFPRQVSGPEKQNEDGGFFIAPLATGRELTIAPENIEKKLRIVSNTNDLLLLDGRISQNNGWFILRTLVPSGATKNAIVWTITPTIISNWRYHPVIHISQIGYHPKQEKYAVIELDKLTNAYEPIQLLKIQRDSTSVVKSIAHPEIWGQFLRYTYIRFDFSDIAAEGLYKLRYGSVESNEFEIKKNIYSQNIWQPTLESFLPVQMCHMRVRDRYRVWHGLCHMDDALMAPINYNHFDGYVQKESTLTKYHSGEHVPGLNIGGWHDAGDDDLRIESQAETVYKLALIYELFTIEYDATSINQITRVVELHTPDGVPDVLQQIEHGVLSILGSYDSMGRLYRGIISSSIRQYVLIGDVSTATDNLIYKKNTTDPILHQQLPYDDRWVFTEQNPRHELITAQTLAAASRVLKKYRPELSRHCLKVAKAVYHADNSMQAAQQINAAAELYLTTFEKEYENFLKENVGAIAQQPLQYAAVLGRVTSAINDNNFSEVVSKSVKDAANKILEEQKENPFGVPYKPFIWGDGWKIQSYGAQQLFLHLGFPDIFPPETIYSALNFILGVHPGDNTASFVSGVGAHSLTVAYGFNRDDWSYIPGGIASGTALIHPDLPELKPWPYFWQQTEYVLGGGTADYLLLAIAADHLLNK